MGLVRYDRVLRRVHVLELRLHHGAVGIVLTTVGAIMALHDRADWREWVPRRPTPRDG